LGEVVAGRHATGPREALRYLRHGARAAAHPETVAAALADIEARAPARGDVERYAAKVYARPREAARAILADPRAPERLAAGQAGAYGELRGRTRLLLGDDAMRTAARQQVPNLSYVLGRHEKARESAGRALDAVGKLGMSLAETGHRLSQLGTAVQRLERATDEPEEALKEVLYRLGREATRAAVSLLPAPARVLIGFALQALERALSHGNELGR
jgi:hypothetical protein